MKDTTQALIFLYGNLILAQVVSNKWLGLVFFTLSLFWSGASIYLLWKENKK